LDPKTGWKAFAILWLAVFAAVWALRQGFIPRDELLCYSRAAVLNEAVRGWNQAHPDRLMDDKVEIDETALLGGGFLRAPLDFDRNLHYYFVDRKVRGLQVKCNKHEDNPLVLKLTGVTLLAILAFVVWASFRRYTLWKE
jgi:hypothetical protein